MEISFLADTIAASGFPLTLSGGDPLMQPEGVESLLREVRARMAGDIWLYTGYTFEEILENEHFSGLLPLLDVIVDGPFIERLKDSSLIFKGSSNQRLIDVQESLRLREPVEFNPQI